jgi:UDP-N-acetylglucosamine 4,6-dehydratase
MKIVDVATAISPNSDFIEIGVRPGEKLHEEMISAEDSRRTIKISENRFLVLPVVAEWNYKQPDGPLMEEGKAYASNTNDLWMGIDSIRSFLATLD